MHAKEAPCATRVLGGDCEAMVFTHFSRSDEQTWQYCDDCVDDLEGDGQNE